LSLRAPPARRLTGCICERSHNKHANHPLRQGGRPVHRQRLSAGAGRIRGGGNHGRGRQVAMKPRRTIADVARLAGVSTATAGRVLGGYGYAAEATREQVLKAAHELGYRPNALARSLITGKTRTVGVVTGDIQNAFYASILRGISDVL